MCVCVTVCGNVDEETARGISRLCIPRRTDLGNARRNERLQRTISLTNRKRGSAPTWPFFSHERKPARVLLCGRVSGP